MFKRKEKSLPKKLYRAVYEMPDGSYVESNEWHLSAFVVECEVDRTDVKYKKAILQTVKMSGASKKFLKDKAVRKAIKWHRELERRENKRKNGSSSSDSNFWEFVFAFLFFAGIMFVAGNIIIGGGVWLLHGWDAVTPSLYTGELDNGVTIWKVYMIVTIFASLILGLKFVEDAY